MNKIAIYPGSFDPVTYGHLDIIQRAVSLFDYLLVAVVENPTKKPLFCAKERVEMLRDVTSDLKGVEISCFNGLLVDYAKERGVSVIIRGLRAVSDFEHEFQMALMNKRLYPEIDTIFMMARETHLYLSSSIVKEIASLSGRVEDLVPEVVAKRLYQRFNR
ncbi:MAG: pantetheine-phosphate adenylyltransferase [bacterium]|nr:pantetheine-phosphate adenylyltransferase [bacterium]